MCAYLFLGCPQNVKKSPLIREPPNSRGNMFGLPCGTGRQTTEGDYIRVHSMRQLLGNVAEVAMKGDN